MFDKQSEQPSKKIFLRTSKQEKRSDVWKPSQDHISF